MIDGLSGITAVRCWSSTIYFKPLTNWRMWRCKLHLLQGSASSGLLHCWDAALHVANVWLQPDAAAVTYALTQSWKCCSGGEREEWMFAQSKYGVHGSIHGQHREYGVTVRPLQQEATAQFCPLHVFPPDVHVIITKALWWACSLEIGRKCFAWILLAPELDKAQKERRLDHMRINPPNPVR